MAKGFRLSIYSEEKTIYEGQIISLTAPSVSGYLGVLADHAPLAARLKPGEITFKDLSGKAASIAMQSEGYLEVLHNKATILL
ncbi:MAG: F0F1 ATP synthase subunit epsilon [Candidatus Omnitrophica bacterium]|nr:F0F1 ATP synthase subunit epsilon [Candidatus Omnitrophota bacterium]